MKEELRVIPKKNYVILGVVIVVTLLLLYYFYMWFDVYKESKINVAILDKYMEVINYNEMDDYIVENPDSIVYVSILEDTEIRKFEKEFKDSFRNDEIKNEVLYLDITNDIENKVIKSEIMGKYTLNSLSILDVPCVMVIEDGMLRSIYSVKDNGYDVSKVVSFINNVDFGDGLDD